MSNCRYNINYNALCKIKEDRYYKNHEIVKLLGVGTHWLPYCVTNYGLKFTETDKLTGIGCFRRLYLGKDIIDCAMAHCRIVEPIQKPKEPMYQEVMITTSNPFTIKNPKPVINEVSATPCGNFMCMSVDGKIGVQTPGSSMQIYSDKMEAIKAITECIWRMP